MWDLLRTENSNGNVGDNDNRIIVKEKNVHHSKYFGVILDKSEVIL